MWQLFISWLVWYSVGCVFRLGLASATSVLLFACIVVLGWCLLCIGLFGIAVFVI